MTINPGLLDTTGKPALLSATDDVYVGATATAKYARIVGNGLQQQPLPVSGVSLQTLSNGNTITRLGPVTRVTNAGAVTGILMTAGSADGQMISVINEGTGSVTFAAVGTSLVLGGTGSVIAVGAKKDFIWVAASNSGNGSWVGN